MNTIVLGSDKGVILSDEALAHLGWGPDKRYVCVDVCQRSNPELVRVCKELGSHASEYSTWFTFVEVPDDILPFVKIRSVNCGEILTINTPKN